MADISTVTIWIIDGDTELKEGDAVEVETTSGEIVKGEVYILYDDSIHIESVQLGDSVIINKDNIKSIICTN
ncbi:hypothetical protein QTL86_03370 [Cellulosilyticum sp. ST5]|uniref:hypothetical protein n=1 Tax=Cellulosilyticum sp. ST5 TaxID=3055805 RepID=UPI0039774ED5